MKKVFLILVALLAFVFVALFGISFVVGRIKGKDIDTLDFANATYTFKAKRNVDGYWNIQAPTPLALGFAMGYLQMHDREFQLEIVRKIARGELASVFGEKFLSRDRLMRFSKDVSVSQYKNFLQSQDLDKKKFLEISSAFVAGVNEFKKMARESKHILPVEYEVFGLERESFENWTLEDLFSIARSHTWEFSYDLKDDLMRYKIEELFGKEKAFFVLPGEPKNSEALYGREELEPYVQSFRDKITKEPNAYRLFDGPFESVQTVSSRSTQQEVPSFDKKQNAWASELFSLNEWGDSAGSNAWAHYSHKSQNFVFCNDTHLSKQWPSSLFPIEYELQSEGSLAKGYALPGLPWLVIGQKQMASGELNVQGIVLANFADVQDLIVLDEKFQESKMKKVNREFEIRNPETRQTYKKVVEDGWYNGGPLVSEIYEISQTKKVLLDWMGFRQTQDPSYFFFKKQFTLGEPVEKLLIEHFQYPAVQFGWAQLKEGQVEIGHMVTGAIFEHSSGAERAVSRSLLEEKYKNSKVKLSESQNRPFLKIKTQKTKNEGEILIGMANQKVFKGELSDRLALHWLDTNRSGRIYELQNEIRDGQSVDAQEDTFSKALHEFFRTLRRQFGVDQLCSQNCYKVFAELDAWKGNMDIDSKPAAIVALFYENLRWNLWSSTLSDQNIDYELFNQWRRSLHSRRLMSALVSDVRIQAAYEKVFQVKYSDLVRRAFKKTFQDFDSAGGAEFVARWGNLSRREFLHPFSKLPEPLNQVFTVSLLGAGVPEQGYDDSLSQNKHSWSPLNPLEFKSNHGPSMKFCTEFRPNEKGSYQWNTLRWKNSTGSSGRPFSRWSKTN